MYSLMVERWTFNPGVEGSTPSTFIRISCILALFYEVELEQRFLSNNSKTRYFSFQTLH